MNAFDLVAECKVQNIDLQAHRGQLHVDAPSGVMTNELLQRLRDAKPELLMILAPPAAPATIDLDLQRVSPVAVDSPEAVADFCLLLTVDDLPSVPFRLNPSTEVHDTSKMLHCLRSTTEAGTCGDCGQPLFEKPTFDGFLNLECPSCDRCFGCRPSTEKVAARFAGKPVKAIQVCDENFDVIGEVYPSVQCGGLELWQSVVGDYRCLRCDTPKAAWRLAQAAEHIRKKHELRLGRDDRVLNETVRMHSLMEVPRETRNS